MEKDLEVECPDCKEKLYIKIIRKMEYDVKLLNGSGEVEIDSESWPDYWWEVQVYCNSCDKLWTEEAENSYHWQSFLNKVEDGKY